MALPSYILFFYVYLSFRQIQIKFGAFWLQIPLKWILIVIKFKASLTRGCNIQLHSDGGCRTDDAAAAWMMRTCEADSTSPTGWQYTVVAQVGIYLGTGCNSFTAEAVALEAMLDLATQIIVT